MTATKIKKKTSAVQFWFGENQSLLQWELAYWCKEFKKRRTKAVIERLERGEADLAQKLERAFKSSGLFTQDKLLILYNLGATNDDLAERTIDYLSSLTGAIFVILVEHNKPLTSSKFYKQIKKLESTGLVNIKNYEDLSIRELEQWIVRQVKTQGGVISAQAVALLASLLGNNFLQLEQEIAKLVAFTSGQEIKTAQVDSLVTQKAEEDVFAVIDALGRRDFKQAIKKLEEQFAVGTSPQSLVGTLAWHLRILRQVRQYVDERQKAPAREMAAELNLHPYVVNKALAQIPYYTKDRLKFLYNELSDLDVKLKSTRLDPQMLFDLFISHLANPKVG